MREDVVDCPVGKPLELPHRDVVRRGGRADETDSRGRSGSDDPEAGIERRRIGRDDLAVESTAKRLSDRCFPGRGWSEERDDAWFRQAA
jgi:hypothetical protein